MRAVINGSWPPSIGPPTQRFWALAGPREGGYTGEMRFLALLLAAGTNAFAAPAGWNDCKWNDPQMRTPKYVVGRILARFPHNANGLERALPEIQRAYPGSRILPGRGDILYIPCVGAIDVIVAAGHGPNGRDEGTAWWWGADEDSEECDQCSPNICDDPEINPKRCDEEEARNRQDGPQVGTNGTFQERRGDRAATTDCGHFRRYWTLVDGAARTYDTGGAHAALLGAVIRDGLDTAELAVSVVREPPPPEPDEPPIDCEPVKAAVRALDAAYASEMRVVGNAVAPCGRKPTTEADAELCWQAAREGLDADKRVQREQLAAFLAIAAQKPACVEIDQAARLKFEAMQKQPCERDISRCRTNILPTLRSARQAFARVRDPGLVSPGELVRAVLVGPPEELSVESRLGILSQHADHDNVVLFKATSRLRQAALSLEQVYQRVCVTGGGRE